MNLPGILYGAILAAGVVTDLSLAWQHDAPRMVACTLALILVLGLRSELTHDPKGTT